MEPDGDKWREILHGSAQTKALDKYNELLSVGEGLSWYNAY